MDYNTIKLSDVTKALRKAGFAKVDGEAAIFGDMRGRAKCFYKYKGGLYINGAKVGFCINSKADAKIFGAYCTSAIDANGAANEFVNSPTHRVNTADKYGNEISYPCWGLDMAEAVAADHRAKFPNDTTEIVEQENRDEIQAYWDKEYAKTQNA